MNTHEIHSFSNSTDCSHSVMLCCFRMSFAASHEMAHLAHLLKNKDDADFTLAGQGTVIKVHSFIFEKLPTKMFFFFSSEFFKTTLTTDVGEKKNEMMEVKEFSHEVLSIAVDLMYGIDIPATALNCQVLHYQNATRLAELTHVPRSASSHWTTIVKPN